MASNPLEAFANIHHQDPARDEANAAAEEARRARDAAAAKNEAQRAAARIAAAAKARRERSYAYKLQATQQTQPQSTTPTRRDDKGNGLWWKKLDK